MNVSVTLSIHPFIHQFVTFFFSLQQQKQQISIVGYFYPYVNQLYCVIRSQSFEIIESFPVQFLYKNKTFIQCTMKLEQCTYVLSFEYNFFLFLQ